MRRTRLEPPETEKVLVPVWQEVVLSPQANIPVPSAAESKHGVRVMLVFGESGDELATRTRS